MMRQSRYDELYGCTDANKTFLESRSDGRIGKKKKKKNAQKNDNDKDKQHSPWILLFMLWIYPDTSYLHFSVYMSSIFFEKYYIL